MRVKGFDKNLCCRGYQFEVGKEYKIDSNPNELELCSNKVFHYCDSLKHVHDFYSFIKNNNRFCEIEVLGDEIHDELFEKYGSNHIRIVREIVGEELEELIGLNNNNTGYFNLGHCNSGECNNGSLNAGSKNNGHQNIGSNNCGDGNSGSNNMYYHNTGNSNCGNRNSGSNNIGNFNSGSCNYGNNNTGWYNNGDYNSGDCNVGNYSCGCFNTILNPKIYLFNKPSDWTMDDWTSSYAYTILNRLHYISTEWVVESSMSKQEKMNYPYHTITGGYLKRVDTRKVAQRWWDSLSNKEKQEFYNLPNFNEEIFEECLGINITD